MAAYAVLWDKGRPSRFQMEAQSLMSAIHTGNRAASASHTAVTVEFRVLNRIAFKLVRIHHIFKRQADKLRYLLVASLRHKDTKPRKQVVDDTVTILHNGGRYLQTARAHHQKLHSVAPRFNAAHTAYMRIFQFFVAAQFRYESKRDRLDCGSRIPAYSRISAHGRRGGTGIQIDVGKAFYGVDRGYSICSASTAALAAGRISARLGVIFASIGRLLPRRTAAV